MKIWGLLLLPALASAQPPCPTTGGWSTNMCAVSGPAGSPTWCEALGPKATDGSYRCVQQEVSFSGPPVLQSPEVGPEGAVGAVTLLLGLLALRPARKRLAAVH